MNKKEMKPPLVHVEAITLDGVFGATLDGTDTLHIHNAEENKKHQDALQAMDKQRKP